MADLDGRLWWTRRFKKKELLENALIQALEKIKEEALAEIQPCYGQVMVTAYTNLLVDLF